MTMRGLDVVFFPLMVRNQELEGNDLRLEGKGNAKGSS